MIGLQVLLQSDKFRTLTIIWVMIGQARLVHPFFMPTILVMTGQARLAHRLFMPIRPTITLVEEVGAEAVVTAVQTFAVGDLDGVSLDDAEKMDE